MLSRGDAVVCGANATSERRYCLNKTPAGPSPTVRPATAMSSAHAKSGKPKYCRGKPRSVPSAGPSETRVIPRGGGGSGGDFAGTGPNVWVRGPMTAD